MRLPKSLGYTWSEVFRTGETPVLRGMEINARDKFTTNTGRIFQLAISN